MEEQTLIDILIPTFISPHLFWIIEKKDLLLRAAIKRYLRHFAENGRKQQVFNVYSLKPGDMVAINFDGHWVRGAFQHIFEPSQAHAMRIVCWLPDYAVRVAVGKVFKIKDVGIAQCPPLAKQASLYNVVNQLITVEMTTSGFQTINQKTTKFVPGVRKVALNSLEVADCIQYSVKDKDCTNLYVDLVVTIEHKKKSLTDLLIGKKLLVKDIELFQSMDLDRQDLRDAYFSESHAWCRKLDQTETWNLDKKRFNTEVNKNA